MLITRQQNSTAEANPSVTKFTKEQNDFKMKELQEYAVNKALDKYHLNLYVLDLNYNSTITEMNKAYRSMARRFHPDNNSGFDTTEMMTMINTAKDGLLDQLRDNDQVREEENVQAAEDEESIPSDHNSDSESSRTSSKPASSHPRPWTSKTKVEMFLRSYISGVVAAITLNMVIFSLQDGWIYFNMT